MFRWTDARFLCREPSISRRSSRFSPLHIFFVCECRLPGSVKVNLKSEIGFGLFVRVGGTLASLYQDDDSSRSSGYGTFKTVKAKFWTWLPGKRLGTVLSRPLFVRKRRAGRVPGEFVISQIPAMANPRRPWTIHCWGYYRFSMVLSSV